MVNGLTARLQAALDDAEARRPGIRHELSSLFAAAHGEARAVLDGQLARTALSSAAGAWSTLHPEVDSLEHHAALARGALETGLPVHVGTDGELWGVQKYMNLDVGWTEALIHYLENRDRKAPFVTDPRLVALPDATTIDVVGDWGTGYWRKGTGAEAVAARVAADRPDYTVHLGDVYYAGTSTEEHDKLIALWPAGARGSFALNSNHEMYDGAHSYFAMLAAGGAFAAQGGCSYVALQNAHWLFIGLDTAYDSTGHLYLDGAIETVQIDFLRAMAAQAGQRGIAVLSHHEGFDLAGTTTTALWQQVVLGLGRAPDAWYWGHAHNGVVYAPAHGCAARCVGHGAIPYGDASMFHGSKAALWSESVRAGDPVTPMRVSNGYARLTLDGPTLREELVAEDGTVRWAGTLQAPG